MPISRRGLLGVLSVGGIGAGIWSGAIKVDLDNLLQSASEQASGRSIGDSVEEDDITIIVKDTEVSDSFIIPIENTEDRVIDSPENAEFVFVEIEVENNDIDSRKLPRFDVENYQDMEKSEDVDTVNNDIAVYAGGDIGSGAELGNFVYGSDNYIIDEEEFPIYPLRDREITADNSLTAWVFGKVPVDDTDRSIRVDIDEKSFRWNLE